ncbi:MAG: YdjY domain-containing protein [Verrucomicrobiota bacterium]
MKYFLFLAIAWTMANNSIASDEAKEHIVEFSTMPHVRMHAVDRYVDVDARVCDHDDMLELVACTEGTKEHESVVSILPKARDVHFMLVLMGAKPGNPHMREAIDESETRWRDILPAGQPIDVSIVYLDSDEELQEIPISQLLEDREGKPFEEQPFLFAGSRIVPSKVEGNPAIYLADASGNFISLSSFGDEVLCLADVYSHANNELNWRLSQEKLETVGEDVVLRLRPQFKN